ncbi:hypothetical protein D9757_001216 [Collybiopsis confluens]|uniref:Up-regulated during septation protein 1 domain-containing protein n=1 Tax=Collybiopsis confluens TaxID=2823264 RepID=A0A8H5MGC5_9AGAR|nr:hypothetical protein D9757_001216 [Collybiopsis confluens]
MSDVDVGHGEREVEENGICLPETQLVPATAIVMNGVRRFLGGAGLSDSQSPGPPAPLNLGSPLSSAAPPTATSSAPIKSPPTTTAALFLKKKDKSRSSLASQSISGSVDDSPTTGASTRNRSNTGSSSSSANGSTRKSGSGPIQRNTRDDLLLSLLASEAVVESRNFAILSSDEVDELKKEETLLASRLSSLEKRLETERKIRDASLTLSTLSVPRNSGSKSASVGGNEQLDAANKRFDETQKEVWRIAQVKSDVSRRLVEHRAGVLSESVRRIEQGSGDAGSGPATPSLSSPASATFNGYFAGHPSSAVPTATSILPQAAQQQITASKKQAETTRELNHLRLEKEQLETMLGMEVQAAEDKVAALETDVPLLEEELELLKGEREIWNEERESHEGEKLRWEDERRAFEEMQQAKGGSEALLAQCRQQMSDLQGQLDAKDDELKGLQSQLSQAESQLSQLERTHAETADDLDSGRAFLQSLGMLGAIGTHIENLSTKLLLTEQASAQKEIGHRQRDSDWEMQKRRLEEDVRAGFDKREELSRELDIIRREREDAKRELSNLKDAAATRSPISPTNGQHFVFPPTPSTPTRNHSNSSHNSLSNIATPDTSDFSSPEAVSILSALKSLWLILPSPEARAAKFASSRERAFRAGTGPSSPTMGNAPSSPGGGAKSISDLDVRSLRSLYDSTTKNPSALSSPQSEFTLQSFISRVQSLLNDDRLLIERLLRFAQAHDLLKKNAERAQKLASEANSALETYQRQVRALEDRNAELVKRCGQFQGEVEEMRGLQEVVDRISAAKSEIEIQAAEQAETCRQLTEANNALSARALALAEEAAQAPDMVRRQMQKEIDEMRVKLAATETAKGGAGSVSQAALQAELDKAKKELSDALEGMEAVRASSQLQNVMLMDELVVTQTENAELKNQLRALKK